MPGSCGYNLKETGREASRLCLWGKESTLCLGPLLVLLGDRALLCHLTVTPQPLRQELQERFA